MSEYKIISRADLYQSEDEPVSCEEEQTYAPHLEFVEVSVNDPPLNEETREDDESLNQSEEDFAFPLFAGAGTTQNEVMRVSLKAEEDEVIINERPEAYYRALNSDTKRKEFEVSAVSFDDIWMEANTKAIDTHPWRVMNLLEHNKKIETDQQRKKCKREGMKKRHNKCICRERRVEREKKIRSLEREEKKQRFMLKGQTKKAYKGKSSLRNPTLKASKPKYRTE